MTFYQKNRAEYSARHIRKYSRAGREPFSPGKPGSAALTENSGDPPKGIIRQKNYFSDSHFWFATVQEVLQADWQELWHLPQPPFTAEAFRLALLMVVMCFKMDTSFVFSRRETSRLKAVSCYYFQYTILCRIFQVLIEIFLIAV